MSASLQATAVKTGGDYGTAIYVPDTLRIAVIAEDLRPPYDEGAKKTSFNIMHALRRRGAVLSVFTRHVNPFLNHAFPLPGNKLLVGQQFRQNLRSQSPDAVLYIPASSGTVGAFVRAAFIKKQLSIAPLALLNLQYRALPARARSLGLHRFVDVAFAQSQASANALRSFGCQTTLLPGGVDSTVFHPVNEEEKCQLRAMYGFPPLDKLILHVGHLNRGRNVVALAHLAKAGFRVVLVASTSTPVDPDLRLALEQAGVRVITDFVAHVQHYYQMADAYLFPVFQATSAIDVPLSVLEAMACNLPVVTTRFGALPGMFQPGSGLYFVDTQEEMVSAVKKAAEERSSRTVEMVSPYSWDGAANIIFETLQGAAS